MFILFLLLIRILSYSSESTAGSLSCEDILDLSPDMSDAALGVDCRENTLFLVVVKNWLSLRVETIQSVLDSRWDIIRSLS